MNFLQNIYRNASVGTYAVALSLTALSLCVSADVEARTTFNSHSHSHSKKRQRCPQELGAKLVKRFWFQVQTKEIRAFSRSISNIFQGGSDAGIVDKFLEVAILSNLDLASFDITNLFATQLKDVLVVSYTFTAVQNGANISDNRISVWKKIKGKGSHADSSSSLDQWKLVSQSIFSSN